MPNMISKSPASARSKDCSCASWPTAGLCLRPKDTLSQIFNGGSNLMFLKLKDRSQREAVKENLTQDFAGLRRAVWDQRCRDRRGNPELCHAVPGFIGRGYLHVHVYHLHGLQPDHPGADPDCRHLAKHRLHPQADQRASSSSKAPAWARSAGLFGCLLGVLVLQYIKSLYFTGEEAVINSTVLFGAKEVLTAVGAAVLITTASAILPILRLTRTPIKNIILNDLGQKEGKKNRLWIAGMVLLAACVIVPRFLGSSFTGMVIASSLATGALVGLVPVVPFLTGHLSRLIGKLPFLSQDIVLGVRNIRDNTSLMNNIQLFSAAIAIVAFMASMFNTMGADLLKAFDRDMKFDMAVVLRHSDQSTLAAVISDRGRRIQRGVLSDPYRRPELWDLS